MSERPHTRLATLVASLADALEPELDTPYTVFGHSMGAIIAFELTRELRARGRMLPHHLFVSAMSAPHRPRVRPVIHNASESAVRKELAYLGGTPKELLANAQLMELMLPTIRADFAMLETYEYRAQPKLPVPMTIFGGSSDSSIELAALHEWREHTEHAAELKIFPGGHFFLNSLVADVVQEVADTIGTRSLSQRGAVS